MPTVIETPISINFPLGQPTSTTGTEAHFKVSAATDAGVEPSGEITLDWHDGTIETGLANDGELLRSHTYLAPGVYNLTVSYHDPTGEYADASASYGPITVSGGSTLETGGYINDGADLYRYHPDTHLKTHLLTMDRVFLDIAETSDGNLWGITGTALYLINLATGVSSLKLTFASGSDWNALTANDTRTGGVLVYPNMLVAGRESGYCFLIPLDYDGVTVDMTSLGVPSKVGDSLASVSIAGDFAFFEGVLYATTGDDTLISIDISTLVPTSDPESPSYYPFTEHLAIPDSQLYALTRFGDHLYAIKQTGNVYDVVPSGTATLTDTISDVANIQGATWFAPGGDEGGGGEGEECTPTSLALALTSNGQVVSGTVSVTSTGAPVEGSVTINWGDGSEPQVFSLTPLNQPRSISHTYAGSGSFAVSAVFASDTYCPSSDSKLATVSPASDCSGECIEAVECNITSDILSPAPGAVVEGRLLIKVQLTDPNEVLDVNSPNFARPGNAAAFQSGHYNTVAQAIGFRVDFGPASEFPFAPTAFVDVPYQAILISGTPRNGVWGLFIETQDYRNGRKMLVVQVRGVGGCTETVTRSVTLANSLMSGVFYRDIQCAAALEHQISHARFGVEVWPAGENPRSQFLVQWGARSGTALDGAYLHEDWPKHQLLSMEAGTTYSASGKRIARTQYHAAIAFRLPWAGAVRVREKWTPRFYLSAWETGCRSVPKIREMSPGTHHVFGINPGKVFEYGGANGLSNLATFEELVDLSEYEAGDAIDAARLGQKIYVVRPVSVDAPSGELFAYDLDASEVAMVYTVRGETRPPRFVEVISNKVLALYIDAGLGSARTRCYDLTFDSPKLKWTLDDEVTLTTVQDGKLLMGAGVKLLTSDAGTAAPSVIHTFASEVTSVASPFVGLASGQIWKLVSSEWSQVIAKTGAISAVTSWVGGASGETSDTPALGIAGGDSDWLWGERLNGSWYDEVQLTVPDDSGLSMSAVASLARYRVEIAPVTGGVGEDATPQSTYDERILIGGNSSEHSFRTTSTSHPEVQGWWYEAADEFGGKPTFRLVGGDPSGDVIYWNAGSSFWVITLNFVAVAIGGFTGDPAFPWLVPEAEWQAPFLGTPYEVQLEEESGDAAFMVYQRSALSSAQGAVLVSRTAAQRIMPYSIVVGT